MTQEPDLAALVGSRICHDLVSPIGAIGNGVELMMLDNAAPSPELALIAESVAQALARIRFFRIAYGLAGEGQRIARGEIVSILVSLTAGGRLKVDWTSEADLPRADARLLFLLIQCLESALAYGGHITVEPRDGGWRLRATAARLRHDPARWRDLAERTVPAGIEPAEVHFALAAAELRARGASLSVSVTDEELTLVF